jgi:hypothetical protein
LATDNYALEDLNTALGTFDNPNVNFDLVAGAEIDNALAEGCGINRV